MASATGKTIFRMKSEITGVFCGFPDAVESRRGAARGEEEFLTLVGPVLSDFLVSTRSLGMERRSVNGLARELPQPRTSLLEPASI